MMQAEARQVEQTIIGDINCNILVTYLSPSAGWRFVGAI
jgi:hypothetical protein